LGYIQTNQAKNIIFITGHNDHKRVIMNDKEVPVAEIKSHLSEYLAISHNEGKRIIITKRGKPFAAIINIDDLQNLEQLDERQDLFEIAGKWEHFDEITSSIKEVYKNRNKDEHRHVSL
jgi:prevent-host-death family protein